MLRYKTDRTWFIHVLHLARKRVGLQPRRLHRAIIPGKPGYAGTRMTKHSGF